MASPSHPSGGAARDASWFWPALITLILISVVAGILAVMLMRGESPGRDAHNWLMARRAQLEAVNQRLGIKPGATRAPVATSSPVVAPVGVEATEPRSALATATSKIMASPTATPRPEGTLPARPTAIPTATIQPTATTVPLPPTSTLVPEVSSVAPVRTRVIDRQALLASNAIFISHIQDLP